MLKYVKINNDLDGKVCDCYSKQHDLQLPRPVSVARRLNATSCIKIIWLEVLYHQSRTQKPIRLIMINYEL